MIQVTDLPTELALPVQVLFERRLPDSIKITLLQLLALAASSPGRVTPPLTFRILSALTGKSRTTLHAHLTTLRGFQDLLCQENLPDGSFIFRMTDSIHGGVLKSGFPYPLIKNQYLSDSDSEEMILTSKNLAFRTGALPDPLVDDLLDAGIYPALLTEIAASGYPATDLKALLAWCRADSPSRPGGLFITRLRQHLHPPGVYYQAPCPKCGRTGGHAPECTARYISGEFADFIEH